MWLIQSDVLLAMEQARLKGADRGVDPVAIFGEDGDKPSYERILTKSGDQAEISIKGVLTKERNILAMIFGGGNTTYSDMVQAIGDADRDEKIRTITLRLSTPGGAVDGLYDALAAVEATNTRTVALVDDKAASAGFILAAACDEIVASNKTSSVGSFGVAVEARIDDERVSITNSASPDKRPDMSTEAGRDTVREYLDALHSIFEESVAAGRGVDKANVTERFGAGAMFVAEEAMQRNMIDRIEDQPRMRAVSSNAGTPSATTKREKRTTSMDLDTLKAEHPEAYRAALELGASQERDRVTAHLTMGEQSGDMQTACTAIRDGSEMTSTLQATYMAAGMRNSQIESRQGESEEAGAAAAAAAQGGSEQDEGEDAFLEQVANAVTNKEVV